MSLNKAFNAIEKLKTSAGFTLVEVIFSLVLLGLIAAGIAYPYATGIKSVDARDDRMLLDNYLRSRMEILVSTDFGALSDSSTDTGFKSPSATGDDYNQWSSPTSAYTSDNSRAKEDRNAQQQDWYNFDFGLPAGNKINGIEVQVEGHNGLEANGVDIELSWDGGSSYTSSGKGAIWPISGSDSIQTFGEAADTWGRTWTDSELSNANFRVKLNKKGSEDYYEFNVDHIQIKIYHTETVIVNGQDYTLTWTVVNVDLDGDLTPEPNAKQVTVSVTEVPGRSLTTIIVDHEGRVGKIS